MNEFTVLLHTHSQGRSFQVIATLFWYKCWATDEFKCFTESFAPSFHPWSVSALATVNMFGYLNTFKYCSRKLCLHGWRVSGHWVVGYSCGFWFLDSTLLLFTVPYLLILSMNKFGNQNTIAYSRCGRTRNLNSGRFNLKINSTIYENLPSNSIQKQL